MSEPCQGIVFRDVSEVLSMRDAVESLMGELRSLHDSSNPDILLSALLRSGELECALADEASIFAAEFSRVCDLLAEALIEPSCAPEIARTAAELMGDVQIFGNISVSRPEGFCFYALHPLDYVDLLESLSVKGIKEVFVIGIRSIGTTLSAAVAAGLTKKFGEQVSVQRMTVRPTGHPYDRVCTFSSSQKDLIDEAIPAGASFMVVDEGPGLSGSSFLSVGEALVAAGVKQERIFFLCSREVDPTALVAKDAARRWQGFQSYVAPHNHERPIGDAVSFNAEDWRNRAYGLALREGWPAVWSQLSAPKYLSGDDKYFFKYEGLGRYGAAVRERSAMLAEAGLTLRPVKDANGFSRFVHAEGRLLSFADSSPGVLERIAEYLAFRANAFRVSTERVQLDRIQEMLRFNFSQAVGRGLDADFTLVLQHPVIADGRMMPHEWLQCESGEALLKLDCAAHGDNHFFPGPVDIAWDVAGTIIEWRLDTAAADYFLGEYERRTNDRVRPRLSAYRFAYAAFQSGYCRVAAAAMASSNAEEAQRMRRDADRYRGEMQKLEREARGPQEDMATSRIPQSPIRLQPAPLR